MRFFVNHIKPQLTDTLYHTGQRALRWGKVSGGTTTLERSLRIIQSHFYQAIKFWMMTAAWS